jgi:sarcosine oxidase
MLDKTFDIAVVGLGAIGSATLMHLAKAGVRVIEIDRFCTPHSNGSSHGETRITRQSIGEGEAYIPLMKRSHELWASIGSEVNSEILTLTGGLIIDSGTVSSNHGIAGFANRTIELANEFNIPHEVLSVSKARSRFPEFNIQDGALIYYEPGAGFIRPELAIQSQLRIAEKHGAIIRNNVRVNDVKT